MTIYVTGIDMSATFDTVDRDRLLEIAEKTLNEDGTKMLRVQFPTDLTVEIKSRDTKATPFTSNILAPKETVTVEHNLSYTLKTP